MSFWSASMKLSIWVGMAVAAVSDDAVGVAADRALGAELSLAQPARRAVTAAVASAEIRTCIINTPPKGRGGGSAPSGSIPRNACYAKSYSSRSALHHYF